MSVLDAGHNDLSDDTNNQVCMYLIATFGYYQIANSCWRCKFLL